MNSPFPIRLGRATPGIQAGSAVPSYVSAQFLLDIGAIENDGVKLIALELDVILLDVGRREAVGAVCAEAILE
jgi:hypothetical protein